MSNVWISDPNQCGSDDEDPAPLNMSFDESEHHEETSNQILSQDATLLSGITDGGEPLQKILPRVLKRSGVENSSTENGSNI